MPRKKLGRNTRRTRQVERQKPKINETTDKGQEGKKIIIGKTWFSPVFSLQ